MRGVPRSLAGMVRTTATPARHLGVDGAGHPTNRVTSRVAADPIGEVGEQLLQYARPAVLRGGARLFSATVRVQQLQAFWRQHRRQSGPALSDPGETVGAIVI